MLEEAKQKAMDLSAAICVLVISLGVVYWLTRKKVKYVFPPGPKGLPLIGSVLDVSPTHLHVSLTEIGKSYSDVFCVNLLGTQAVVLNSMDAIREALATDEYGAVFAGRPFSFLGVYTDDNCSSFSFMSTCKIWKRLRKTVYKTINMYGDGVQKAEDNILEELSNVIQWLEERNGQNVDLADVIVPSLSNIMTYLLVGHRYEYDNPALRWAVEMAFGINAMGTAGIDAVMTKLPFLRFFNVGYGRIYRRYMDAIQEYLKYYYHDQKKTYNPADKPRGLIDVLLKLQEELRDKGDNCPVTDQNITSTMKDTIEAGTLTTRASLLTFFLAILHRPEVAHRIQQEVDREIGGNIPSLNHRPSMPYTEAAVLEIMRFVTPIPLALPHCTLTDVKFRDYFLPKDTLVIPNYWGVHHNEEFWEKPFEFRPERFLDESGQLVPLEHLNRRNLLAFSIGKRSCPGENFAKSRVFLFITSLLQRFSFHPPDGAQLPPCDSRQFGHGIVPCPKPYNVLVESRS